LPIRDKPSAELVLGDMKELGFSGTELDGENPSPPHGTGNVLPREPETLNPLLEGFGLELAAGWFQTRFLEKPFDAELDSAKRFADKLAKMNTRILSGADFSFTSNESLTTALLPSSMPTLTPEQWRRLARGWSDIARHCRDVGLTAAYHPHLGSPVLEAWQIDRFFAEAPDLHMLLDTGHLAAAGVDYLHVLDTYAERIAHIHLKSIRLQVVDRGRAERFAWQQANVEGLFTVPGYGGINCDPIFSRLRRIGYEGWIILEAEQDPHRFSPFAWGQLGREFVRQSTGW
jgi:inosose dehydratase